MHRIVDLVGEQCERGLPFELPLLITELLAEMLVDEQDCPLAIPNGQATVDEVHEVRDLARVVLDPIRSAHRDSLSVACALSP